MKRLMIVVCTLLLLSGCAQKLPVSPGENYGVWVVPMDVRNETADTQWVFYYELSNQDNENVKIVLEPKPGKGFAFSNPLPAGEYVLDTYTTYAQPYNNMSTSFDKKVQRLNDPIKIKIESRTILIDEHKLEIVKKNSGHRRYQTLSQFKKLNWNEKIAYIDQMGQLENSEDWHILGTWEL